MQKIVGSIPIRVFPLSQTRSILNNSECFAYSGKTDKDVQKTCLNVSSSYVVSVSLFLFLSSTFKVQANS